MVFRDIPDTPEDLRCESRLYGIAVDEVDSPPEEIFEVFLGQFQSGGGSSQPQRGYGTLSGRVPVGRRKEADHHNV
jgi:hypothetical protein